MAKETAVQALIARVSPVLWGSAPLGGTIKCDFGVDGCVFVNGNPPKNSISYLLTGSYKISTNAVITTTLDVVKQMQSGSLSPEWAVVSGRVAVSGDSGLALRFGELLQKVSP